MAYKVESCGVCKGGHPTKQHKMAEKMANHDMKADLHNWNQRAKRMNAASKKDETSNLSK